MTLLLRCTSLWAAFGAPLALAAEWASDPQPLRFVDVHESFSLIAFDTGYLPDVNDLISVRFHITPSGGVVTDFEATSHLEWPEPLTHRIEGEPGTGWFGVDTSIEMEAEVHLNIPLVYTGSIPLWSEYIDLASGTVFDPMPLVDDGAAPVEVELTGTGLVEPYEFEIAVITGVDLVLAVEVYPELQATLAGISVDTEESGQGWSQSADGQSVVFLPPEGAPELELTSTYVADIGSLLSVVIEPSASVDTWIGDFELLSFPIDVPLVDASELRTFNPVTYVHPLPALGDVLPEWGFGEVVVGTLANLPVSFENLGRLTLVGYASIAGSDRFTVFPELLVAPEGLVDGLVVTFEPEVVGEAQADLVLQTNDPSAPEVVIPLTGAGFDPAAASDPEPTSDSGGPPAVANEDEVPEVDLGSTPLRTCGCAMAEGAAPSGGLLLAMAVFVRRQRLRRLRTSPSPAGSAPA